MDTVKIRVQKVEYELGDTIILASDGFYEARKSSFESDLIALSESANLKNDFDELFTKYELSARDDMTAIAFRYSQ